MENRNGLVIDLDLTIADGRAERDGGPPPPAAPKRRAGRRTVAADKGYDTRAFGRRLPGARPSHPTSLATSTAPTASAIDRRTTRHPGYASSMVVRRRIEQVFGLAEDLRRSAQGPLSRASQGEFGGPPLGRRLQPHPHRPPGPGGGPSLEVRAEGIKASNQGRRRPAHQLQPHRQWSSPEPPQAAPTAPHSLHEVSSAAC